MNGTVVGGWNFVVAAYVLTAVVFVVYGVSLITRLRDAKDRASEER